MSLYLVISDTHDNLSNLELLRKHLAEFIPEVTHIIHLGDFTSPFTLRKLLDFNREVTAVLGNNDGDKVLLKTILDSIDEQPIEVKICGLNAVLLHGFKSPQMTAKIVKALAVSGEYDIVLYGHTHRHHLEVLEGTLVMNPGALSGYLSPYPTYGLLDFRAGKAHIISLKDGRYVASANIPKRRT